ncbi:MAG: NUDIX hydrolase [Legionellaceae bacterium]|nr:NUDIX hydrolase [Legionellaceae bacterium]
MPRQFVDNGVPQNATLALTYKDAETKQFFFLLGQSTAPGRSKKLIFPGGQVDQEDFQCGTPLTQQAKYSAYKRAAQRELEEETNIDLQGLNPNIYHVQTESTPASNGHPPKAIHFYAVYLGELDKEAITTLNSTLKAKDDLGNLQFKADTTNVKGINAKHMAWIKNYISQGKYKAPAPNATAAWLKQPHTTQASSGSAHKAKPRTTSPSTSHTINFKLIGAITLASAGVGLILLGVMASSPVGLIGAASLLLGLGLYSQCSKGQSSAPTAPENTHRIPAPC